MPEQQSLNETAVHKGRVVRPGDIINILPAKLREQDPEHGDYFAKQDVENIISMVGKGPFKVSLIRRWPCGQVMIYLDDNGRPGAGVYAEDFM